MLGTITQAQNRPTKATPAKIITIFSFLLSGFSRTSTFNNRGGMFQAFCKHVKFAFLPCFIYVTQLQGGEVTPDRAAVMGKKYLK